MLFMINGIKHSIWHKLKTTLLKIKTQFFFQFCPAEQRSYPAEFLSLEGCHSQLARQLRENCTRRISERDAHALSSDDKRAKAAARNFHSKGGRRGSRPSACKP